MPGTMLVLSLLVARAVSVLRAIFHANPSKRLTRIADGASPQPFDPSRGCKGEKH